MCPPALFKIVALLLRYRAAQLLEDGGRVFPDLALLGRTLVSQKIGWVISDHERRAFVFTPAAAQIAHRSAKPEQSLDRGGAERDEDARLNYFNLLAKIGQTGLHFTGSRRP